MIDEMDYKPLEKNVIKRPTNCFAQLWAKLTQHIRFTSEPIINNSTEKTTGNGVLVSTIFRWWVTGMYVENE